MGICECGCGFEIGSKEFQEKHVDFDELEKYLAEQLEYEKRNLACKGEEI